jgi:uncharacterized protein (DUF433 family)
MSDISLIGIGLYTVPEAARLTGISVPRIRRWLTGYRYRAGEVEHASGPLWTPEVPKFGSKIEPLSTQRFRTDGRTIFLEVAGEIEEPALFDLKRDQYLFHRMVAPSFKDIEFEDGVPARWWPASEARGIVLDPKRSFGKPIVAEYGVPAAALADAYKVRRSFKLVSLDYEVPEKAVRESVAFQERLAA